MAPLKAAGEYYDSRSPGKGKPHPDKHRKTTIAGVLLKVPADLKLENAGTADQETGKKHNALLEAAGRASIEKQREGIKFVVATCSTPKSLEPVMPRCNFWKTEKETKYVLTSKPAPHSVPQELTNFVEFAVERAGGEQQVGAPPRGPLFR